LAYFRKRGEGAAATACDEGIAPTSVLFWPLFAFLLRIPATKPLGGTCRRRRRTEQASRRSRRYQPSLRRTSLMVESSADSVNGLISAVAFTRLKEEVYRRSVSMPGKKNEPWGSSGP